MQINEIRKQMNLALYSAESAGNRDLMRSVRRIICTELQKLAFFCKSRLMLNRKSFSEIVDYLRQNEHQIEIITLEHFNGTG